MNTELPNINIEQENLNSVEVKLESLDSESHDFFLEKEWFQDLLPELEAKSTFVATTMIENICSMNPKAVKILNKEV